MKKNMIAFGLSGLLVAGCASQAPTISSPIQLGDAQLSCTGLEREMVLAHGVLEKAKHSGNGVSAAGRVVKDGVSIAGAIASQVPGGEAVTLVTGVLGRIVSAGIDIASRSSHQQARETIAAAATRMQMLERMYATRCAR
jgi:hypothetical protein